MGQLIKHIGRTALVGASALVLGSGLLVVGAEQVASAATPQTVSCGETITASVTVANNIGPCVGSDGLDIGASNITVNLNGHTITGNSPANVTNTEYLGINLTNVSGVTIKGPGTVQDFDAGVSITGGSGDTIKDITATANIAHVLLTGSGFTGFGSNGPPVTPGLYTTANCNYGDGITTFNTKSDTITGNTAYNNGPFSGISLVGTSKFMNATGNTTYDNQVLNLEASKAPVAAALQGQSGPCGPFSAAANGPGREDQDIGFRLEGPGAQHDTVSNNTSYNNMLEGISIHGNVCPGVFPITFPANDHNTVSGNNVFGNGFDPVGGNHDGIGVLSQGPTATVCIASDNTIANNTSTGNGDDGIFVGGRGSGGNTITNNILNRNVQYGIYLTGPTGTKCGPTPVPATPGAVNLYNCGTTGNRISGNTAHFNGALDAFDGNPNCQNPTNNGAPPNPNIWTGDNFGTVNQMVSPTCIS